MRVATPHRLRQASRTILAALSAWAGDRYGIDPAYLGVLLAASVELAVHRMLGR
jgi:energy-converting hydrogenase Eha subunit B